MSDEAIIFENEPLETVNATDEAALTVEEPQDDATIELGSNVQEEMVADPEGKSEEESDEASELFTLRAEVERLKAELLAKQQEERATSRINSELSEFEEYFPEVTLDEIPDEVWDKVRGGASLSATYSLFKRKRELERIRISELNEKNRKMSAGSLVGGDGETYYSPAEVKRMTPAQVKKNYDRILESMRHWN